MANLSQIRREKMLNFLETLKEQHSDDASLIAINQIEKELTFKKYGLVWEEHEEEVDIKMRTHIPVFTEVEDKEIVGNPESEQYNFLLEGDNLHSLKLLEKTHKGKIDVIYIDPPYNTGGRDFVYDDDIVDKEDGFRHSKWLSFISERLKVARILLNDTGCILISINDYEFAQLKLLCDEIFGETNFISMFIWHVSGNTSNSEKINNVQEYILCYAKKKTDLIINDIIDPNTDSNSKVFKDVDNTVVKNGAKNPASFITLPVGFPCAIKNGLFQKDENFDSFFDEVKSVGYITRDMKEKYRINYPAKVDDLVIEDYKVAKECRIYSGWSNNGKYQQFIDSGFMPVIESDGSELTFYISANGVLFYKKKKGSYSNILSILENMGTTQSNKFFLESLGVNFSFPKPTELVKYLISIFAGSNAIILDFFAGSGTTFQSVCELNSSDGGNRTTISCTNNENEICKKVTYPRIKAVITGKKKDGSFFSDGIKTNLKYYKTEFVCKENEDIYEDLLEHIKEMIQLEYRVKVDNSKYVIIMDDDEMDEFEENISSYSDLKAVFINQDVMLTTSQEKMLQDIDVSIIPDRYFDFELREVGELW